MAIQYQETILILKETQKKSEYNLYIDAIFCVSFYFYLSNKCESLYNLFFLFPVFNKMVTFAPLLIEI